MVLVVGPWVGYNLSRFDDPVFISSGFGVTLASANCPELYRGPSEGYWSLECAVLAKDIAFTPGADESVQSAEAQAYALHIIGSHASRILPVEMARLGRAFAFFHPLEQVRLDSTVETRPYHWALVGLGMYYAMLALSVGGVVILVRRRVPVLPLAGRRTRRGRLGGPDLRADPVPEHLRDGPRAGRRGRSWTGSGAGSGPTAGRDRPTGWPRTAGRRVDPSSEGGAGRTGGPGSEPSDLTTPLPTG